MKKNKMMRLASALLVLVLLTTCAISGTFAKYITTHNGSDSARVAKWGVIAAVKGSLFEDAYKDAPTTYTAYENGDLLTVQAAEATNLVAPGTRNDKGMSFILSGKPEVDVDVSIVVTGKDGAEKATDVVLPAGTYTDYTNVIGINSNGAPIYGTFTLDEDYHPLVFTLTAGDYVTRGTLPEVEKALEDLSRRFHTNTELQSYYIDPQDGTQVNGTYTLTWAWDFDGNGAGTNDAADTYLGNLIAGVYNDPRATTEVSFGISVTVTQVD